MPRRRRSEPLRYQIRNDLLDLLVEEGYQPGDQIPTEQELVDMLDVSRSTLREGLHLLEEERIIRTKHGAGRFLVATPNDYQFDLTRLQSVTEMLAGYGIQVITQVVDVKEQPADAEIASNLGLQVSDPVLSIERIRYAESVPIIYSIDILPKNKIQEPWDKDMFAGSLLSILEQRGVFLDHTRTTIRVVLSDAIVPRYSMIESRVPWILLEQVNYNREGEPIIYSFDYHRGDYITFHVNRYRH
jgi:GntR family transcriptional regulator